MPLYFMKYTIIRVKLEEGNLVSEKHVQIQGVIEEVSKVIVGKEDVIQLTLSAFLAGGHVLYEDVPGIGKTMLARALSRVMDFSFNRIQFTPDMMPSDLIGVSIYNASKSEFEFKQGPLFADMILADEINRTTPRTQSALLEAMSESQITQDGKTHLLSENFFVLATQNPDTYEGTYPLPEAQLDRFVMRLSMGYPSFLEELDLLTGRQRKHILPELKSVLTRDDIDALKRSVDTVHISPELMEYALTLVRQTRKHPSIRLGVSPRGAIDFVRVAKAHAVTENREYCIPEDFIRLYKPVVGHRIHMRSTQDQVDHVLDTILRDVKVPV